MEDNKYNLDDLMTAIVDEKPAIAQAVINQFMIDNAHDEISNYDIEFNKNMFNKDVEDMESEEDIDDDVDLDATKLLNNLNSEDELEDELEEIE